MYDMVKDRCRIQTETSRGISKGIRIYHLKRSRQIKGNIPIREWADALRYGVIKTQAPESDTEEQIISLGTLTNVADTVRDIGGTKEGILVKDLEKTITNLLEVLERPEAWIESVSFGAEVKPEEVPRVDSPIVGLYIVTQKEQTKPIVMQLSAPIVKIEYVVGKENEEIIANQLPAPEVKLFSVVEDVEEDVVTRQLPAPTVEMHRVTEAETPVVTIVHLAMPNVSIEQVEEKEVQIEEAVLSAPVVDIYGVTKREESIQRELTLDAPNVTIKSVREKDDVGGEVYYLSAPVVELLEAVAKDVVTAEIVNNLNAPNVRFFAVTEHFEEPSKELKLDAPEVNLLSVKCPEIEITNDGTLMSPAVSLLSATIYEKEREENRLGSPRVTLKSVTEKGSDVVIEAKPLQSPKDLKIDNVTVAENITKQQYLPAPQVILSFQHIKDFGAPSTVTLQEPKVTILWAYVGAEATEPGHFDNQLPAPIVDIYTVESANDTAVLGKAILGLAVLGKT